MKKTPLKKALLVLLPLLSLGSLASAGRAETLKFAWPVNAGPLNPHLYTPNQLFAQNMVYEPLVRYGEDGKIHPCLAESWERSKDGKTYIFHLRKNVKFSNGERFDAQVVKQNFEAILANRSRHIWLESVNQISKIEVLSPFVVRITLKESYYPLLEDLSLPRPFRFIAPSQFKNGGTKDGIIAPIGTGPWKLTETKLGESDFFTFNTYYRDKKPDFDTLLLKVIPDPNSRAIALETGEVDLVEGINGLITPEMFQQFSKNKQFKTALSAPSGTLFLALNSQHSPTKELEVRKALNHAIDKDALIKAVFHNSVSKADFLFAKNIPYADISLSPYSFDPEAASALLEKAGWHKEAKTGLRQKNGQPLRLTLCFISTEAQMKALAEIIQSELRAIGIETTLIGEEESSIFARQREGNFDMIFEESWGAPFTPAAFVSAMRTISHADYQAQRGLPDKAQIDAEITALLDQPDKAKRQALYKEVLTRLHEDAVYLPLLHPVSLAVTNEKIAAPLFGATVFDMPFMALQKAKM